jgi:hypothetical protein
MSSWCWVKCRPIVSSAGANHSFCSLTILLARQHGGPVHTHDHRSSPILMHRERNDCKIYSVGRHLAVFPHGTNRAFVSTKHSVPLSLALVSTRAQHETIIGNHVGCHTHTRFSIHHVMEQRASTKRERATTSPPLLAHDACMVWHNCMPQHWEHPQGTVPRFVRLNHLLQESFGVRCLFALFSGV